MLVWNVPVCPVSVTLISTFLNTWAVLWLHILSVPFMLSLLAPCLCEAHRFAGNLMPSNRKSLDYTVQCIASCELGGTTYHHAGEEGHGIHEDLVDTVHMIRSNGHLAVVLAVQMFGLLAYNYAGASESPLSLKSCLMAACALL